MLEKITHTFSDIFKKISGKASISEKNIEDAVEEIKMALLEADVNLRVIRRFVNSTIEEAKGETVLRSVNHGQQFIKKYMIKLYLFSVIQSKIYNSKVLTQNLLFCFGLARFR